MIDVKRTSVLLMTFGFSYSANTARLIALDDGIAHFPPRCRAIELGVWKRPDLMLHLCRDRAGLRTICVFVAGLATAQPALNLFSTKLTGNGDPVVIAVMQGFW